MGRAKAITFRDPTLHLMLLDEVLRQRHKKEPIESLRPAYQKYLKRTKTQGEDWGTLSAGDDYNFHEAFQAFALELSMTKSELASIRSLFIDGDHTLLFWIHPGFVEDGRLRVHDLSGIEQCTALEHLDLGVVEGCSLAPLAGLLSLKRVHVWRPDEHSAMETLLELPKLAKLEVANLSSAKRKKTWRTVMAALRDRGVDVIG
jgi:hypothetical protein